MRYGTPPGWNRMYGVKLYTYTLSVSDGSAYLPHTLSLTLYSAHLAVQYGPAVVLCVVRIHFGHGNQAARRCPTQSREVLP